MTTLNATEARTKLYALIMRRRLAINLLLLQGKEETVLLAEEDWNAINETLNLLAVPGMRESIREGIEAGLEECDQELDW